VRATKDRQGQRERERETETETERDGGRKSGRHGSEKEASE